MAEERLKSGLLECISVLASLSLSTTAQVNKLASLIIQRRLGVGWSLLSLHLFSDVGQDPPEVKSTGPEPMG